MAYPRDQAQEGPALGLLETRGLIAAVEGTDAMLKAAHVRLLRQERTIPALITSLVVGETAAVQAAIDAGRAAAERVGTVVAANVIPLPASEVRRAFAVPESTSFERMASRRSDLEDLTVAELRRRARDRGDENFSGRTISKASKSELLDFLKRST